MLSSCKCLPPWLIARIAYMNLDILKSTLPFLLLVEHCKKQQHIGEPALSLKGCCNALMLHHDNWMKPFAGWTMMHCSGGEGSCPISELCVMLRDVLAGGQTFITGQTKHQHHLSPEQAKYASRVAWGCRRSYAELSVCRARGSWRRSVHMELWGNTRSFSSAKTQTCGVG